MYDRADVSGSSIGRNLSTRGLEKLNSVASVIQLLMIPSESRKEPISTR